MNHTKIMPTGNTSIVIENTQDYTVTDSGEAFVSQRKAAELMGVNDNTLRSYISRNHKNDNTINGLDSKTLQSATMYFAIESRTPSKKAAELLAQLAEGGAKAFIYTQAGYKISAAPVVPQPSFTVPQTYAEALRLAADLSDKAEALTAQVEEMKPSVAALERLTEADGTFCFRDAAKQLNLNPKNLAEWLSANNWAYKNGSTKSPWIAYQSRIDAGLMMHKTTETKSADGITTIRSQARITAKGLTTISKTIEKANRTAKMLSA